MLSKERQKVVRNMAKEFAYTQSPIPKIRDTDHIPSLEVKLQ